MTGIYSWWAMFLMALIIFLVLAVIIFLRQGSHRRGRTKHMGSIECPHCGSLQTDRVAIPQPDGTDSYTMRCFACDEDFD